MLLLAARTHAKTMLAYLDFLQIRIYELSGYSKLEGLEMAGLVLQKILSFSAVTSVKTFEPSPLKFGIKKRVALKKEAIPKIFKWPPTSLVTEIPPKKQTRKAAEKLTNARVSTIMFFYLWLYTSHADC